MILYYLLLLVGVTPMEFGLIVKDFRYSDN